MRTLVRLKGISIVRTCLLFCSDSSHGRIYLMSVKTHFILQSITLSVKQQFSFISFHSFH